MIKVNRVISTFLVLLLSVTFLVFNTNRAFANTSPIMCDNYGARYCINRAACGNTQGSTWVIAWSRDFDNCEDAYPVQLSLACGGGVVTSTCPFALGSGLNTEFKGSAIDEIQFYNEGTCLASNSSGKTIVGTCPGSDGSGGSNGTVFADAYGVYFVDRYWSKTNEPAYLCDSGYDQQLSEEVYYDNNYCAWAGQTN